MASNNKKNKAKNSHIWNGAMKSGSYKGKRLFYYNPSHRQYNKKELRTILKMEN